MEEIALCQNEIARTAHKELFNLSESAYLIFNGFGDLISLSGKEIKVHLCLNWEGLLKIILWTESPPMPFIMKVLKTAGIEEKELRDMSATEPLSLFHWLYYGKRFRVLRRLCAMARQAAEEKVRGVRFECHLIAEETSRIVASTL